MILILDQFFGDLQQPCIGQILGSNPKCHLPPPRPRIVEIWAKINVGMGILLRHLGGRPSIKYACNIFGFFDPLYELVC